MEFMPDDSAALEKALMDILDQYEKDDIIEMLLAEMTEDGWLKLFRSAYGIPDKVSDELIMEHIHAGTVEELMDSVDAGEFR